MNQTPLPIRRISNSRSKVIEMDNSTSRKRPYSPSPSRTPYTLSRSNTFETDFDDNDSTRWTTKHWKKLEEWYIKKDCDYQKAANSFYYHESLVSIDLPGNEATEPEIKELWTKEQVTWRCQCLDTDVKAHDGLLPSERKKLNKKQRKVVDDTLLKSLLKHSSNRAE